MEAAKLNWPGGEDDFLLRIGELEALEDGVRAVVILDGRVPHATLLELFTEHGAGSLIRTTEPRVTPRGLRQVASSL